jgi:hypothetical protein
MSEDLIPEGRYIDDPSRRMSPPSIARPSSASSTTWPRATGIGLVGGHSGSGLSRKRLRAWCGSARTPSDDLECLALSSVRTGDRIE